MCRGHLGTFFAQNDKLFSGLWEQNFRALTKNFSTMFLKVHSRCAEERSSLFSFPKQSSIFSKPEKFSHAVWDNNTRDWSQKCTIRVRSSNLEIFFERNDFLIMYFARETFRLWAKLLRQNSQFFVFRVQKTFWYFFYQGFKVF